MILFGILHPFATFYRDQDLPSSFALPVYTNIEETSQYLYIDDDFQKVDIDDNAIIYLSENFTFEQNNLLYVFYLNENSIFIATQHIMVKKLIDILAFKKFSLGKKFNLGKNIEQEMKLFIADSINVDNRSNNINERDVDIVVSKNNEQKHIDKTAIQMAKDMTSWLVVKDDRATKTGDRVLIDFQGFVDNKEIETQKATNFPLLIGSRTFLDGFEDQITGMFCQETRVINMTYPVNYSNEKFAGKNIEFIVKINEIQEQCIEEFDMNVEKFRRLIKKNSQENTISSDMSYQLSNNKDTYNISTSFEANYIPYACNELPTILEIVENKDLGIKDLGIIPTHIKPIPAKLTKMNFDNFQTFKMNNNFLTQTIDFLNLNQEGRNLSRYKKTSIKNHKSRKM